MKYSVSTILILLVCSAAFGQNKLETAKRVQETIKKLAPIKAYVASVEETISFENTEPDAVVTDVADYNNSEKPEWKWFESREAFEASEETYTTAFIWKKDGKFVQVNFTYSSPSGDWAQYVFHTFYPDGRAARVDRELRTFMGDVIVNRISYYDTYGIAVAKYTTYRDLQSRKLITKPESFEDMAEDFYLNVGDLPFLART